MKKTFCILMLCLACGVLPGGAQTARYACRNLQQLAAELGREYDIDCTRARQVPLGRNVLVVTQDSLRRVDHIGLQVFPEHIVRDIMFIESFRPQMIGLGPYIPQDDTPFAGQPAGDIHTTLMLLSIFRLMFPDALIPSTTALATLAPDGRERGILAGANVVMPNLSPEDTRAKYALYNDKKATGLESAEGLRGLENQLEAIGYHISFERGDYAPSDGR